MRAEMIGIGAKIHAAAGTDVVDRMISGDLKGLITHSSIQVENWNSIDEQPWRNLMNFNNISYRLKVNGGQKAVLAWYTCRGNVQADANFIKGLYANGWPVWLNMETEYANRYQQQIDLMNLIRHPLLWAVSYPTTPAERFDLLWYLFDGMVYCPQSYFCQFPEEFAKVQPLFWSTYAPNVVWIGWSYRVNFQRGAQVPLGIRWVRIDKDAWRGDQHYFGFTDGGKNYWFEVAPGGPSGWMVGTGEKRNILRVRSDDSLENVGKFLGFAPQGMISPTIGTYNGWEGDNAERNAELVRQVNELKNGKTSYYRGLNSVGIYLMENTKAGLVKQIKDVVGV